MFKSLGKTRVMKVQRNSEMPISYQEDTKMDQLGGGGETGGALLMHYRQ